ncbi:KfrA protein [Escherichia coli]|nr:KfrA protein [Escherichia coli]
MTQQAPKIPADVRERIIAAATDLFEQSGRETMPTVDAVRRAARVDMNAASAVMKEWRRAQTAQAAPVAVAVPESVQQASSAAVATIWQQAQELANESLRSAQAAWETERAEQDAMRQELAEAFERQAGELEALQSRLASIEAAEAAARGEATELRGQLAAAQEQAHTAEARAQEQAHTAEARAQEQAHTAEARAQEIERRAGELRTELDRAHQTSQAATAQLDQVRGELAKVQAKAEAEQEAHQEQRKAAATEAHRMAERLTAAQAERDQATKAAGQAREEAARMAGQIDTLKEQSAALLARITPAEAKPTRKKPGGE